MARILYGVHGSQHGHAIRALIIARAMPQHEFLFVSSEEGAGLLSREYRVERFRNPGTRYKNYKIDMLPTLKLAADTLIHRKSELARLDALIREFKPDAAVSDYEYFTPIACKRAGIPCLSLDHQHVISHCVHDVPRKLLMDYLGIRLSIKFLFDACPDRLIISFFQPPVKPGARAVVAPPILRESVLAREPRHGEHILVYQSCSISDAFAPFLRKMDREFRIYGYNRNSRDGNLTFKTFSEEGFLDDLASAAYVICGGGHSLMSEALYYGKPVMSFPVGGAIEQHFNALYLERLGYGRYLDMSTLTPDLLPGFETRLEAMRASIGRHKFRGNEDVFSLVGEFAATGRLRGAV